MAAGGSPKTHTLDVEFDYYVANQEAFVKEYDGQVIVLKGCQVIGAYSTYEEAVRETRLHHALGTFLVQKVTPGREAYTATFSRVRA